MQREMYHKREMRIHWKRITVILFEYLPCLSEEGYLECKSNDNDTSSHHQIQYNIVEKVNNPIGAHFQTRLLEENDGNDKSLAGYVWVISEYAIW